MKQSILQLSAKQLGKAGVYCITCNGHNYIGSSKNLYARLREHKSRLLSGKHPNDFMLRTFKKYGIHSFNYEILEFCSPDKRIQREKYYIDTLKPDFNLQLDPVLKTLSVYSRQKLGKSVKLGRSQGKYKTKFDYCSIEHYDYLGNYIKTYQDKEHASIQLQITKKAVQALAGGYNKGLSSNGVRLRYSNSSVPVKKFDVDPNYLGRHYDFYTKDNKFAFNSVKNVWKYFANEILSGKTEFHLKLKLKTN